MVPEANQVPELMEIREVVKPQELTEIQETQKLQEIMGSNEVLNRKEVQARESFHNKEGILKKVKEVPEGTVTKTEKESTFENTYLTSLFKSDAYIHGFISDIQDLIETQDLH